MMSWMMPWQFRWVQQCMQCDACHWCQNQKLSYEEKDKCTSSCHNCKIRNGHSTRGALSVTLIWSSDRRVQADM